MSTHIQLELLDVAGNMFEKYDSIDLSTPGLLEVRFLTLHVFCFLFIRIFLQITGINQHVMATASGLNDYDYQNLSNLTMGHKQINQIQTINKIPIPPEILEHFKRA